MHISPLFCSCKYLYLASKHMNENTMTTYMKNVFVIIYRHEILSARRELSAGILSLEKLVTNVPVTISQTFLFCSLGLAFLF